MKYLFSVFFGAGVAAWVYTKMGARLGYGNAQNVWTITLVSFVLATLFFLSILVLVLDF